MPNFDICPQPNPFMPGMHSQPGLQCRTGATGERVWDADWVNSLTVQDWRSYLLGLAITRFEWVNCPEELDPRFIELCLTTYGWGCFFEPMAGYLAFCPATQDNNLDMYYNPRKVRLVPANGEGLNDASSWERYCKRSVCQDEVGNLVIHEQDAVACFDNMLREPLVYKIELAAMRLSRIYRAADVNVNAQLTPWVGVAKETAKLDLERYMNQVLGMESVVLTDEAFASNVTAQTIPTTAPFVADDLLNLGDRHINRILTQLGIDNAFSQKKEREVAGEMNANNEQIYVAREQALRCRQAAARKCNELFGTDLQVRFASRRNASGGIDFSDEEV